MPADVISRLKEMSNNVNSNIDVIFDEDEEEIEFEYYNEGNIINEMGEDDIFGGDDLIQVDEEENNHNGRDKPELTDNYKLNEEEKVESEEEILVEEEG